MIPLEFALISDIHSNYIALERVLRDIRQCKIEKIYCLGDLAGYGPFPDKVFPFLEKHNVQTVMGNYDEAVGFDKDDCGCYYSNPEDIERGKISLKFAKKDTSDENKKWLRNLPRSIDLEVNGLNIKMVHGSPKNVAEFLYEDIPAKRILDLMGSFGTDILFCAHTHLPYNRRIGTKYIINPGSVGRPRNKKPLASYAVVELDARLRGEIRYVDYDYEKHAKEIEESELPDEFAEQIREGFW